MPAPWFPIARGDHKESLGEGGTRVHSDIVRRVLRSNQVVTTVLYHNGSYIPFIGVMSWRCSTNKWFKSTNAGHVVCLLDESI